MLAHRPPRVLGDRRVAHEGGRAVAVERSHRDADDGAQAEVGGESCAGRGDGGDDRAGHVNRLGGEDQPGQEDGELVVGPSGDDPGGRRRGDPARRGRRCWGWPRDGHRRVDAVGDPPRHLADQLVPRLVTEGLDHRAQTVQGHQEHGGVGARGAPAGQSGTQPPAEGRGVGEPGEPVVGGVEVPLGGDPVPLLGPAGHVDADRGDRRRVARVVEARGGRPGDHPDPAIAGHQGRLDAPGPVPPVHREIEGPEHAATVLGGDEDLMPHPTADVAPAPSAQRQEVAIGEGEASVGIGDHGQHDLPRLSALIPTAHLRAAPRLFRKHAAATSPTFCGASPGRRSEASAVWWAEPMGVMDAFSQAGTSKRQPRHRHNTNPPGVTTRRSKPPPGARPPARPEPRGC